VHEAVYILDGLIKHTSDIRPDTVHGDTHAQRAPVFALAHLLGIDLMPRIRDIKDLIFYKPDRRRRYKHIESLFHASIDWSLIERHFPDMLRVAISIQGRPDDAVDEIDFSFKSAAQVIFGENFTIMLSTRLCTATRFRSCCGFVTRGPTSAAGWQRFA
jgi:TnpA family transposase